MKIGIVIATFYRSDFKTKHYLTRALNSVNKQSHKDYQIYLIGDDYIEKDEFNQIASGNHKIKAVNLPIAKERSIYPMGDYRLYCSGGLNASHKGVEMALNDGIEYICHLGHDDWWEPGHLKLINEVIENYASLFTCTLSTYYGRWLPNFERTGKVYEYIPAPGCCILSASCIKYIDTQIRARDVFAETGDTYPSDADLWQRMGEEMKRENKTGYLIASLTCHHDEEGYTLKNGKRSI